MRSGTYLRTDFALPDQVLADFMAMGVVDAEIDLRKDGKTYALHEVSSGEWQLLYTLANLALNVRDNSSS